MKANESFYPLTVEFRHKDEGYLTDLEQRGGISMRDKLAHDYCIAHFSNPDSAQQYAIDIKRVNKIDVTFADYQNAIINQSFLYADEFIKKSQENGKSQ